MKKSNIATLSVLLGLIVVMSLYMIFGMPKDDTPTPAPSNPQAQHTETTNTEEIGTTEDSTSTEIADSSETQKPSTETQKPSTETQKPSTETQKPSGDKKPVSVTSSMKTALFIGDSRTVGIKEYSGLKDPDYFATVGMMLYNVHDEKVKVNDSVGTVTLKQLLDKESYDKIYIMLGINEVGNNHDSTAKRMKDLIALIHEKQPGSIVIMMSNIHVSKDYQTKKPAFASANLNALNNKFAALANNSNIFYLDGNVLFDDAEGNLDSSKTGDGAHLKAVHYKTWTDWIVEQTKEIVGK